MTERVSDEVRRIVHAFPDQGRRDDVRALAKAVRAIEDDRDSLRGLVEHQGRLLAELPPSADQLIMAEMSAAVARTELRVAEIKLRSLGHERDALRAELAQSQRCTADEIAAWIERSALFAVANHHVRKLVDDIRAGAYRAGNEKQSP